MSDAEPGLTGYAKGRRTRARIVDAASDLFAAHGYEGTSIEQIARAVGTTKGAIYAHFKRKRALYLACMEDSLGFFREPVALEDVSAEERLRAYLLWLGGRLAGEPRARSFFVQMIREPEDDEPKIELIRNLLTGPYAQLRDVIAAANPDVDAGAFAFFIFSTLLLDPELHRFHVLMAGESARSHTLAVTVDELVDALARSKT